MSKIITSYTCFPRKIRGPVHCRQKLLANSEQEVTWTAHISTRYLRGKFRWTPTIEGKRLVAAASSNDGPESPETAISLAQSILQAGKQKVFVQKY